MLFMLIWKNLLLTVFVRFLKPATFISADEISTSLLENLDNYLQDTNVGEQVELVLDAQKLALAERQRFRQRAWRHFKAATKYLIRKCPISSNSHVEALRCLDPMERKKARCLFYIVGLAREIALRVSVDDVGSERILLQAKNSVEPTPSLVDHYWHQIFSLMDAFDGQKCTLFRVL